MRFMCTFTIGYFFNEKLLGTVICCRVVELETEEVSVNKKVEAVEMEDKLNTLACELQYTEKSFLDRVFADELTLYPSGLAGFSG